MGYEKLIERLRTDSLYADKASLEIMDLCMDAATALSTLQAENKKLRARNTKLEDVVRSQRNGLQELRAELEQVKQEKSRIPEGYALVKLELLEELDNFRDLGPIDRLRELAQADREGRCVVLPIKIPGWGWYCNDKFPNAISAYFDRPSQVVDCIEDYILRGTKEQAEAALKAREQE